MTIDQYKKYIVRQTIIDERANDNNTTEKAFTSPSEARKYFNKIVKDLCLDKTRNVARYYHKPVINQTYVKEVYKYNYHTFSFSILCTL